MDTLTDPHALAAAGLCHYSGDMGPIDHGGFWYNAKEWAHNDYASAVEVCCLADGPHNGKHVVVSKLVINRPSHTPNMRHALESCGLTEAHAEETNEAVKWAMEIEAVKGYMGGEPDCSDWREPSSYSFIIPDDMADAEDFAKYAKIHGAEIVEESAVWELLARLVGRDGCE